MKINKALHVSASLVRLAAASLALLVLGACMGPLDPPKQDAPAGGVRISIDAGGGGRTILPTWSFDSYVLSFVSDNQLRTHDPVTLNGNKTTETVELSPAKWTITVKAIKDNKVVASGKTADDAVTVTSGVTTSQVTIQLTPEEGGTEDGTLSVTASYPASPVVQYAILEVTSLPITAASFSDWVDLSPGGVATTLTLPEGYYLAVLNIENADGEVHRSEVVYIKEALTTNMGNYTFVVDDFGDGGGEQQYDSVTAGELIKEQFAGQKTIDEIANEAWGVNYATFSGDGGHIYQDPYLTQEVNGTTQVNASTVLYIVYPQNEPDAKLTITGLPQAVIGGSSWVELRASTGFNPAYPFADYCLASGWMDAINSTSIEFDLYSDWNAPPIDKNETYIALFGYETNTGPNTEWWEGYAPITFSNEADSVAFSAFTEIVPPGPDATITITGLPQSANEMSYIATLYATVGFDPIQYWESDTLASDIQDATNVATIEFDLYAFERDSITPNGTYIVLFQYNSNYPAEWWSGYTTINLSNGAASVGISNFTLLSRGPLNLSNVTADTLGITYSGSQSYNGTNPGGSVSWTHYLLDQTYEAALTIVQSTLSGDGIEDYLVGHTSLTDGPNPWVVLEVANYNGGSFYQIHLVSQTGVNVWVGKSWSITSGIDLTFFSGSLTTSSNSASGSMSWPTTYYFGTQYLLGETADSALQTLKAEYGLPQHLEVLAFSWYYQAFFDLPSFVVLELNKDDNSYSIRLLERTSGGEEQTWIWN